MTPRRESCAKVTVEFYANLPVTTHQFCTSISNGSRTFPSLYLGRQSGNERISICCIRTRTQAPGHVTLNATTPPREEKKNPIESYSVISKAKCHVHLICYILIYFANTFTCNCQVIDRRDRQTDRQTDTGNYGITHRPPSTSTTHTHNSAQTPPPLLSRPILSQALHFRDLNLAISSSSSPGYGLTCAALLLLP